MIFLAFCLAFLSPMTVTKEEAAKAIAEEERNFELLFERIARLYEAEEDLKEITADLLAFPDTKPKIKEEMLRANRRVFVFIYPCDGLKIKGYISFVPNPAGRPVLYMLRGGTEIFGLMNPASRYSMMKDYTVIGSAQRGGVSEGKDEYGGDDVHDIAALFSFFPSLEKKLQISFRPRSVFALGGSRGAMELFLALARYPHLQKRVDKIISLSGLLDMEETLRFREDMLEMFVKKYGLVPGSNEKEWVARRDPIRTVPFIRRDLPILIIQGANDVRTPLSEGRHMVEALKENGNRVEYWEIEGGDHCIGNESEIMNRMADWLDSDID